MSKFTDVDVIIRLKIRIGVGIAIDLSQLTAVQTILFLNSKANWSNLRSEIAYGVRANFICLNSHLIANSSFPR